MTRLTDLSQPELDVMQQLVQARTTNIVVLAADLWRTTPDWQAFDPYPLIVYTLDSLSERGLCTFRIEAVPPGQAKWRIPDMPFDIRLTPQGWDLMGYGHKTVEVGSLQRHEREPLHPGDMTDYLNLHSVALGGPIEVDDFPTHRDRYPQHVHMYGVQLTMANTAITPKRSSTERLADPRILQDPNGDGNRGYIRVTADMEARVLAMREVMGTASYGDLAEAAALPERTIRYILTDLPRLRRSSAGEAKAARSLKERVLAVVQEMEVVRDVAELRRIVGMADTEHDVVHVLHSLHTQGRIDFTERGSQQGKATVVDIRLPKKGSKRVDRETYEALPEIVKDRLPEALVEEAVASAMLDDHPEGAYTAKPTAVEPEATTQETPLTTPSAPEPEAEGYPLLDALLDRERKRQDSDSKGMAFVVAAEAIQQIDPETAASLMKKAEVYNVPFPSPIEQEYIRYVAAHSTHPERTGPQ
jgi:hypothetical protein